MTTLTMPTSAQDCIERILNFGQEVADDSTRVIRKEDIKIGQPIAQGDVNLIPLGHLPSRVRVAKPFHQLAPGDTRGSRHCIAQDDMHKVKFYEFPNANAIQGPVLEFTGDVTIEHPEHGNQVWPGGTIVGVTYQVKYADELRRTQD